MDRLEGLLANALAAGSRAKAELIEERSERQSEAKGLNDAVKSAEHVSTELRRRLTVLEGENERLLQDQDVRHLWLERTKPYTLPTAALHPYLPALYLL